MALTGIIIGIFLWIAGIFVFLSEYLKAKRCTCEASAVILDVREEVHTRHNTHRSRRYTYYYPTIEFSTPDETFRVKANFKAYNPDTYAKGNQLDILYNPQNPYDVKLRENTLWEGIIGMAFLFILGAVLMYLCVRAK